MSSSDIRRRAGVEQRPVDHLPVALHTGQGNVAEDKGDIGDGERRGRVVLNDADVAALEIVQGPLTGAGGAVGAPEVRGVDDVPLLVGPLDGGPERGVGPAALAVPLPE